MIDAALRAAAAFVDDGVSSAAWDPHRRLSAERLSAKGQKIRVIAEELRSLADACEGRDVQYAEYAALKDRLYAIGLPLTLRLDQGIATAIHGARSSAQSPKKGWLKLS